MPHQEISFGVLAAVESERAFASPEDRHIMKFDETTGEAQKLSNIQLQQEFFAVAVLPGMERGPTLEVADVPTVI